MIILQKKADCCGCESCVQKCPKECISFEIDEEGFYYPKVDYSKCVNCHICEQVCPIINQGNPRTPHEVYAAYSNDESVVLTSSSGGLFSLLAEKIIDQGGVVFGVSFDGNWSVSHKYSETKSGLVCFRGSKYVQSRIGQTYIEAESLLKKDRYVLFSGTPCQIAGLWKFLHKDYQKLYTVDVICHGVPSPGVWNKYLKSIRPKSFDGKNTVLSSLNEMPEIASISFRDKRNGWEKFGFVAQFVADEGGDKNSVLPPNNVFYENHYQNLFMKGFLRNLCLRPSCYDCPARSGKSNSDILLGDFWGVKRRCPEMYNANGVGLVLVYTQKGAELVSGLDIVSKRITYEDVIDCNENVEFSVKEPRFRTAFFKFYAKIGVDAINKYCRKMESHGIPLLYKKVIGKMHQLFKVK